LKERAPLQEGVDFYWEGAAMVLTRVFHLRRGECCGSCCRHCPFAPRWTRGAQVVAPAPPPTEGMTVPPSPGERAESG